MGWADFVPCQLISKSMVHDLKVFLTLTDPCQTVLVWAGLAQWYKECLVTD